MVDYFGYVRSHVLRHPNGMDELKLMHARLRTQQIDKHAKTWPVQRPAQVRA